VKNWMETAGSPYLDVKEFAALGKVEGGPFHSDAGLNHELVMLDMQRTRLHRLIERYRNAPPVTPAKVVTPTISIEVGPGTARMNDGRVLSSADITVWNTGDPFTLVTYARLVGASPGFEDTGQWHYDGRNVRGGNGESSFHIATLGETGTSTGTNWLVKVRGEQMITIRRWEGHDMFWFDVEWTFQLDIDSVLRPLAVVVTRVRLSDDHQRFNVIKASEKIMP
jgi:hypothetical protein